MTQELFFMVVIFFDTCLTDMVSQWLGYLGVQADVTDLNTHQGKIQISLAELLNPKLRKGTKIAKERTLRARPKLRLLPPVRGRKYTAYAGCVNLFFNFHFLALTRTETFKEQTCDAKERNNKLPTLPPVLFDN